MNISGLTLSSRANIDSSRSHRPANIGLPDALILPWLQSLRGGPPCAARISPPLHSGYDFPKATKPEDMR